MDDGRRPTRFRCALAWLALGLWAALLAVTIIQLEPNELFDFRPPIIVVCFVLAVWRPYALVRRMLTTLTRVSSDALIGSAFVLDLAGFGLLWWQLTTWPPTIDGADGSADVMFGVGVAAAIVFGANIILWRMLMVDTDAAQAYRLTQLGTRHDHKALRLRGIDPSDPNVWRELVQRHLERQPTPADPVQELVPFTQSQPSQRSVRVNELLGQVRADNSLALRRLGDDGSFAVMEQVRARFISDFDDPSAELLADHHELRDGFAKALGASRVSDDRPGKIPQISLRQALGLGVDGGSVGPDETLLRLFMSPGRAEVDAALAQLSGEMDEQAERTQPRAFTDSRQLGTCC